MAENNNGRITGMLLSKSRRAQYIRVFAVLAACVVLAVVVVLHQIGIAMTHEERVLTCPIADVVLHTHNDDCYDADGNLVCNLPIHVLHTHNADCYDSDGNLVCVLPELELHTHGDDCYTEVRELTCGLEESKDHVHTDDCYKVTRVLTCGKEEVKLHTHNEDCYTEVRELTCGLEESKDHVHTDDCYKVTRVLTCGKEEVLEEHVHGPGCFTTITVEDKEEQNDEQSSNEQSSDEQSSDAENTAAEVVVQNTMPAQEFEGEILDQDGKLWLHVSVKAPEGAFPAGTTMEVAYVKSSDVEGVVSKTIADAGDKREVDSTQAVDIVFRNADGVEIEPLCPITVSMTSDKIADGNTNPVLVHVDDKGKGEVVDQLSDKQAVERKVETGNDTLAFDAEAFSVYVIAYTVDFHWDVDGETYDFSIPGGGFVSFTDLIEVLGIADGTYSEGLTEEDALTLSNTTVSDKTKKFVADVKSVEFSNPDLVWVGKVEADSTVGDLKKANGLDVQYSAELSEEQIQQINAQTVKSGDWALISKLPFLSEESLTVTMNNGEVFTIKVTDAQDPSIYVGDNKEVIIYDNGEKRAMTSTNQVWDGYRNQLPSIPLEEAETNQSAHWKIEATNTNGRYYLKSSDGKYLRIKGTGNKDISLVNNSREATELVIQAGSNPDYRIYAANHQDYALYYCDNKEHDGFFSTSGGANNHNSNNQDWLYIKEVQPTPDPAGDWLLYLDDDFDEITIHVGETITLRPYNKWEWKENDVDVQTAHWNIDGKDNGLWDQIDSGDDNGAHKTEWNSGGSNGTAGFHWTAYVKKDTQLETHYWSVQGRATSVGNYELTNTKNDKRIIVHVVDGAPVIQPSFITDTVDIKVNLFDYDKDYLLDPKANDNLANNTEYKNDSTNKMGNGNHFYFMSSGSSGAGTTYRQNDYTQGKANHGIVQDALDREGYPQLVANGGNRSLKYLFDTSQKDWHGGNNNDGMIAYPNVNGMFQKDSDGYYYYNSNTNYFYYDASTGQTKLYEHTYTQTSGEDKGSLVNDKPIGFFPFHDYDATSNLYVNQNHNLNHHLGMSMEIPFKMNNKKLDEFGKPIIFEFTGDDDLWVFAEWEDNQGKKYSKLVLDIGGIHQPVYGYIDFTNDVSSSSSNLNLQPNVDYKLKVYYMERGGCDSNLAIRFNLPVTNVGDIPFTKVGVQGTATLQGAVFGLYKNENCTDDAKVRQATSDGQGHVLFKDLEIGIYYMKEITPPNGYQPSTKIYRVEVKAKNYDEITLIDDVPARSDYTYTISNIPNKLTVKKVWLDNTTVQTQIYFKLFKKGNTDTEITNKPGYETDKGYCLNATNNWQIEFKGLEDGQYYVVEEDLQGYRAKYVAKVVVDDTDSGVTTTASEALADENGNLTILNKPRIGSLQITKAVTVNNQAPTDKNKTKTNGTYEFKVNGKAGTNTAGVTHTVKITFADGKATSYQIDDEDAKPVQGTDNAWTVQLLNLTPGKYTIEEIAPTNSGMVLQTVTGGDSVNDSKVATVTVAADETSQTQATARVQFTNNYTEYEVVIVKVDTGSLTTKLGGAEFDLYEAESVQEIDGKIVPKSGAQPVNAKKLVSSSTEGEGKGKVTLGTLAAGTYYLFETKAPSGYIAMASPVIITIEEGQIMLTQGSKQERYLERDMTNGTAEIMVMNSAGVELPHTGGSGTRFFTILGGALILGASALLVMKRRRL